MDYFNQQGMYNQGYSQDMHNQGYQQNMYGQGYSQDMYGQDYAQQSFNQNLYGEQMYNGKRFSGYSVSELKQGLISYVMNLYQKPVRREVTLTEYPMSEDNDNALYGNMRHACATRGVCYLAPQCFYIPEMDMNMVFYYCEDCNTLYYSKAHTADEARQRKQVLQYNNQLIRQQEREQASMIRAYNRNVQRYYKEMERAQNRAWKEQIKACNQRYY